MTSQSSDGNITPAPAIPPFFLTEPVSDLAITYFYGHLFAAEPEIGSMFPAAMDTQRHHLYRALSRILVTRDGQLDDYLAELGRAHRKFGVRNEHYAAFRTALLAAANRFAPPGSDAADAAAETAWLAAFDRAAELMTTAAHDDAARAPAWWTAEVTAHEQRTPHVAVLTVRPGEPFRYLPGQHLSVQTPRWPRLWRRYSIANAPRDDGSLTLHVRAVDGGLVSNTLVHHLEPGDILLLGQAEGRMTADTTSSRPVLCLAGGTGLAPLKAIIEAIAAEPGSPRNITLFHGTIPDLGAKGAWDDADVYISGPDAMIVKAVSALRLLGADPARLHYDLPDES